MKKRLLSALLALCMVLALLPAGFAAGSGYSDSGSTTMAKLTKSEIVQLLKDNPLTLPDNVFETEPSYAAPYAPGKVKQEALQAALNRLNALRRIAGLPSVALDSDWCDSAQYGAVLLSVSEFSHYPSKPADMDNNFYTIGRAATSTSNIYGGVTLTRAVDGFMDDSDSSNVDRLGHRRWQLNPSMSKVGFGYALHGYYRQYVDEKVFQGYSGGGSCNYNFIAWPASGNFPNTLFGKNVAWSVTVDPSKYQTPAKSAITVTLVRQSDGKSWAFSGSQKYTASGSGAYFNVETSNYGVSNCIIFRPDGVSKYDGVYTVTITGLKTKSGAAATLSYQVDFFDPNNYTPESTSAFPDVPAGMYYTDAVAWAVKEGYVQGKTNGLFDPDGTCSEAEILTLLHHAVGYPGYTNAAPFAASLPTYCRDAVNWAYEKGLIKDSFQYNTPCTRAKTIYFLWMAKGSQRPKSEASFPDVSANAYYAKAVAWAMEEGIVQGNGSGAFNPNDIFNRAMVATLVYKTLVPGARK